MKGQPIDLPVVQESESQDSLHEEVCQLPQQHAHQQSMANKLRSCTMESSSLSQLRLCPTHTKKADLICLNDFAMVCTDCAIFGAHKNHELKRCEEVEQQRMRKQSDIGKVLEECRYSMDLLSDDEYAKKMFKQQHTTAKDHIKLNFRLLRELIDVLEAKSLKELESIYAAELSKLRDVYRVERQLGYKVRFWMVRSTEEMRCLSNLSNSTLDISKRLYTQSEQVLQGGFDMLLELEKARAGQLHQSNLLAKEIGVKFDYKCLDMLEAFAMVGQKQEPLLDGVENDWSSIECGASSVAGSISQTTNQQALKNYASSDSDFEVVEIRDDLTVATDLDTSILSVRTAPLAKKSKGLKLPEKIDSIYKLLQKDRLDSLDLTNAELGDSLLLRICEELPSKKIRSCKLIRNKLTDQGLQQLIPLLKNMITVNLSQNNLTDKAIDMLISRLPELPQLKNIVLSQNRIKERNVRDKLKHFLARGVCLSL